MIGDSVPDGSHDRFVALADISRSARVLEEETVRLHPEDAISTKLWVEKMKEKNVSIFFKSKIDPPPEDSGLQEDVFMLCMQTAFQMDAFRRLGNGFIGIDATHNTTQYQNLQLYTVIARDRWARGVLN